MALIISILLLFNIYADEDKYELPSSVKQKLKEDLESRDRLDQYC